MSETRQAPLGLRVPDALRLSLVGGYALATCLGCRGSSGILPLMISQI